MMARYRSILAVILAFVATFVVSCSSPAPTQPKTYTPLQLEQIQRNISGIAPLRDRFSELSTAIQNRDWNEVESFIHGPMAELRFNMNNIARGLLPDAQSAALEKSRSFFERLVTIDQAAQDGDYDLAIRNYAEAVKDIDAFLALAPKA